MTTEQDRERARALAKILDRHLLAVRIAEALAAERERVTDMAVRFLEEHPMGTNLASRLRALLGAGQPAEGDPK